MAFYKSKDEWQEKFDKWKSIRDKKFLLIGEERPVSVEVKKITPKITLPTKSNKLKIVILSILVLIIVLIGYFAFKTKVSNLSFSILVASLFILCLLFFTILFAYRVYEKSIHHLKPLLVLSVSYALIIANMLLSPKIYALEWAFLGFLAIAVIFYDFKIDSRFLILPALLLLGYVPFLLIGAQKEIAETIAVFVYYFLVVGVGLQIIEHYKKTINSIEFEKFIETFLNKDKILNSISIWGVITLAIIILNRFKSLEFIKWSSVYIFVLLLVFYTIDYFQEQKQYTLELEQK